MQTWVCTQASRNVHMGVAVCVYTHPSFTLTLPHSPSSRKAALGSGNYTGQQAPLWTWSPATFIWTFLHHQLSPICSNVFTFSSLKLVNCPPLYLIPGGWFGANSPICWDLWILVLSCRVLLTAPLLGELQGRGVYQWENHRITDLLLSRKWLALSLPKRQWWWFTLNSF